MCESPISPSSSALGVKAARAFLEDFPADRRAMSVAYEIGQAYEARGRSEEAISAYRDFLEIKYYEPAYDEETTPWPPFLRGNNESGESHAERFERLRMSATYKIGEILFSPVKEQTGNEK